MNKTPVTIWVNIDIPEIKDNKVIVKKGNFMYNGKKYIIENGEIKPECPTPTNDEQIPF